MTRFASESIEFAGKKLTNCMKETSPFRPKRNVIDFHRFVYLTEKILKSMLSHVSRKSRDVLGRIRNSPLTKEAFQPLKEQLCQLIQLRNFEGQPGDPFTRQIQSSQIQARVLEVIQKRSKERIDWQLSDFFLGFCFFSYFVSKRNFERGYVILCKSYEANKPSINIYVAAYCKYYCIRDQLVHYLGEKEREVPKNPVYRDISLFEWHKTLFDLHSKLPFIYDLMDNRLSECISVTELKEIFKQAGDVALRLKDYAQAAIFIQNYLHMLDSIDRVDITRPRILKDGEKKSEKVDDLLYLNQIYLKYNNKLLSSLYETHQYVRALTFIINNLFIFSNTLYLLQECDPHAYPTKKPNDIISMDVDLFDRIYDSKKRYTHILTACTREWQTTMAFHTKIWDFVSQTQNKGKFKTPFFLSLRECISRTEKMTNHDLKNYLALIAEFTSLPRILHPVGFKEYSPHHTVFDYTTQLEMDYYFPTFVGNFDKHFIEIKMQEVIYMNSENLRKLKRHLPTHSHLSKKTTEHYAKDTNNSSKKRLNKLQVAEVDLGFSTVFDSKRFVSLLFRNCIAQSFELHNPDLKNFDEYYRTVILNHCGPHTDALLKTQFAKFIAKLAQLAEARKLQLAAKLNKKLPTFLEKRLQALLPGEDLNKVNSVRAVEEKPLGYSQSFSKHSRFSQEYKATLDSAATRLLLQVEGDRSDKELKARRRFFRATQTLELFLPELLASPSDKPRSRRRSQDPVFQRSFSSCLDRLRFGLNSEPWYDLRLAVLRKQAKPRTPASPAIFSRAAEQPKLPRMPTSSDLPHAQSQEDSPHELSPSNSIEKLSSSSPRRRKKNLDSYNAYVFENSRAEIEKADYRLAVFSLDQKLRRFRFGIRLRSRKLELYGLVNERFRESRSSRKNQLPQTDTPNCDEHISAVLDLPVSKNVVSSLEQFSLSVKYVFQTYWPIIYTEFKSQYMERLFVMPSKERKLLLGADEKAYKKLLQELGWGLDIQFIDYREPLDEVYRLKRGLKQYLRVDVQALQVFLDNVCLLFSLVESLILKRVTGFSSDHEQRSGSNFVQVSSIIDGLAEFGLNFGYYLFLEKWLHQLIAQRNRSKLSLILSLRPFEDPRLGAPKPLESKTYLKQQTNTRHAEAAKTAKCWATHFLTMFKAKLQILKTDSSPADRYLKLFLGRTVNRFSHIGEDYYSIDIWAIVDTDRLQDIRNSHLFEKEDPKDSSRNEDPDSFEGMYKRHLREVKDESLLDNLTLLLVLAFLQKTIEIQVDISHNRIFKAKALEGRKSELDAQDFLNYTRMDSTSQALVVEKDAEFKNYIVKKLRGSSNYKNSSKMSFIHLLFFWSLPAGPSASVWNLNSLVHKEALIKQMRASFADFDLFKSSPSVSRIKTLVQHVLASGCNGSYLRKAAVSMINKNSWQLVCFLREKALYSWLKFEMDERMFQRKVIGEYEVEWDKLNLYLDPYAKFLDNAVIHRMCRLSEPRSSIIPNATVCTIDLRLHGNFESYLKGSNAKKPLKFSFQHSLNSLETAISKSSSKVLTDQNKPSNPEEKRAVAAAGRGRRQAVREQVTRAFDAAYNEVFNANALLMPLQEIGDIAAKLEIFEHQLQVIHKSAQVYTNTKMPLATAVKRYHAQKHKTIVDIFKPTDLDHYSYVHGLFEEMLQSNSANFNTDVAALAVRLEQGSRGRPLDSVFEVRLARRFSDSAELRLLRNSLQHDLFSLFLTFTVVVRACRLEVLRITIRQKFQRGVVHKFAVCDPHKILMLLRILSLRPAGCGAVSGQVFQFMCFTSFLRTKPSPIPFKYRTRYSWISSEEASTSAFVYFARKPAKDRAAGKDQSQTQIRMTSAERLSENSGDFSLGLIVNQAVKNSALRDQFFFEGDFLQDRFKHALVTSTQQMLNLRMPGLKFNSFSFLFTEDICGLGPAYVTANVFLLLVRQPSAEQRRMYCDTDSMASSFFETLANRIFHLSKVFFGEAAIQSDDPSYVKQKIFQRKVRRALDPEPSLLNFEKWGRSVQLAQETTNMYPGRLDRLPAGQASPTAADRIFKTIESIRRRIRDENNIILDCEDLLVLFEITPKCSRIKAYKVPLAWKDIKAFFATKDLILNLFPRTETLADFRNKLIKTPPKALFILVLRFILSFFQVQKTKLYRSPVFKLDKEMGDDWANYAKNVYSKFGNSKGPKHQQKAEVFSRKISVVYSCIRKIEATYYIVTVSKNSLFKLYEVVFYCPKFCRTYTTTLKEASFAAFQPRFLCDVIRYLHQLDLGDKPKLGTDFRDFDALWTSADKKKRISSQIRVSSSESFAMQSSPSSSCRDQDLSIVYDDKPRDAPASTLDLIRPIPVPRGLRKNSYSTGKATQQRNGYQSLAALFDLPESLASFEDVKKYFYIIYNHLKSTSLIRAFKKMEESIFSSGLMKQFMLRQGDAFRELRDSREGTSKGALFSAKLAASLLASTHNFEMKVAAVQQFWDEMASNFVLMYATAEGVTRLTLKLGEEVQVLREVFGSVEFLSPDGSHTSSRVYLMVSASKPQSGKQADANREQERLEADKPEDETLIAEKSETEKKVAQVAPAQQIQAALLQINRPFPEIRLEFTPLLYLARHSQVQATVQQVDEKGSKEKLMLNIKNLKKIKNLRELANSYVAVHKEATNVRSFRHFKIGNLRYLAGFFVYKAKRSKNLDLLSENEGFEDDQESDTSDQLANPDPADDPSLNPED